MNGDDLTTNQHQLAALAGIQTSYQDVFGLTQTANPDALAAVLRALGHDASTPEAASLELEATLRRRWHYDVEPVAVSWDEGMCGVAIRCPDVAGGPVECFLSLESGETHEWRIELHDLPVERRETLGSQDLMQRRLEVQHVPFGYHSLRLRHSAFEKEVLLIGAPTMAYQAEGRRSWGVFSPLYALRAPRSWGVGDIGDLQTFADWVQKQGGRFIATLPLLSMFLGETMYSPSPYSPVSKLYWNELYVDIEKAIASSNCAEASMWIEAAEVAEALKETRGTPRIQYQRVQSLKRDILTRLAKCGGFDPTGLPPRILDYARFRATHDTQRKPWQEWPERLRDGDLQPSDYDADAFLYYAYAQDLASRQLGDVAATMRARDQLFYLDLPIGSHSSGYDAWRYRDVFAQGIGCGAPPDSLFTGGQNWGLPPLIPQRARETHYRYFREVLEQHLSLASILRFDHVIGLHRLYWVPQGFSARDGVFVQYPAEELYAILSLESHRKQAVIVGENLGTVPPEVNQSMTRHGLFETYVVQYELPGAIDHEMRRPPRLSLAGMNTHDMPTFAGYWAGSDIGVRRRIGLTTEAAEAAEHVTRAGEKARLLSTLRDAGLLAPEVDDPASVLKANLAWLRQSDAQFVVINLEDLWLETETHNIPGTIEDNWQRPSARSMEEFPDV